MESYQTFYFKDQGRRIITLQLLAVWLSLACGAQVYNYDPVRHNQFESNPAYLASGKYKCTSGLLHQGTLIPGGFYSDVLRLSFYSSGYFAGLGFSAGHVHVSDTAAYSYAGLGGAYRSVLFNRIYTRIGLLYKIISIQSPPGSFTYYGFRKNGEGGIQNQLTGNANVSISFSSANEKHYLSAGILNARFAAQKGSGLFPAYYFINAGDFAKMLGLEEWEMSYTLFTKKYAHLPAAPLSHYLTVLYSGFHLSRRSSLRYGARIGYTDASFIQCDPVLAFYHRTKKRSYLTYQLACDAGMYPRTHKLPFKPALQFNITYLY